MLFAFSLNSFGVIAVEKPGIASSLSIVPPVNPRPLPLILATVHPAALAIGATISVVLSPTPPDECLSTVEFPNSLKSSISPL